MPLMIPNLQPQSSNIPNALQKTRITTEDGYIFTLTLVYYDQQQNWFYSLNYIAEDETEFAINGIRLTVGNVLINYRNQIPFGLWCTSEDGGDPSFDTDFTPEDPNDQFSARIKIYSLTKTEMDTINDQLSWVKQTQKYLTILD